MMRTFRKKHLGPYTRHYALITAAAFIIVMMPWHRLLPQNRRFPTFIGMQVCKKCHEAEGIGNQYKSWKSNPHARAFQVLSGEKALAIALKKGVRSPSEERTCLKCHTTGGGKIEETRKEGVGCEACHGPGSLYHEFSNHASFTNREQAYRKAVSLGMYPIVGIDGIKSREKLCRYCHNDERPCLPENPVERKRQKLPLSLIADFIFKHPIRR